MYQLDSQTIEDLQQLCQIQCTPEEKEDILNSLRRILDYVEQLGEVDTTDVPSCNFVLQAMLKNVMRSDEVADLLPREEFLANAPDKVGGMIRVPPILKDL